jgi:TIR domain
MTELFDVFLSYNRDDKLVVSRIAKALADTGIKVWFDEWNLTPGVSWQTALEDAITNSKSALVFIGHAGVGPWQQEEMYSALSFARHERRPVVPVVLPDANPAEFPIFLRTMNYVRIESLSDEDFKFALRECFLNGRIRLGNG